MAPRLPGTRGIRRIKGQEYFLAGRGSGVRMAQEAKALRQTWARVCIRAWGRDGVMLDDYAVYVHGRKETS